MQEWKQVFGFLRNVKTGSNVVNKSWTPDRLLVASMTLKSRCEGLQTNTHSSKPKELVKIYDDCEKIYLILQGRHIPLRHSVRRKCIRQQSNRNKQLINIDSLALGNEMYTLLPAFEMACMANRKYGTRSPILYQNNGLAMLLQVVLYYWTVIPKHHNLYNAITNLLLYATARSSANKRPDMEIAFQHSSVILEPSREVIVCYALSVCMALSHEFRPDTKNIYKNRISELIKNVLKIEINVSKQINSNPVTRFLFSAAFRLVGMSDLPSSETKLIMSVGDNQELRFVVCDQKTEFQNVTLLLHFVKTIIQSCPSKLTTLGPVFSYAIDLLQQPLDSNLRSVTTPLLLALLGAVKINTIKKISVFCDFFERSFTIIHKDTLWAMRYMFLNYSSIAVPVKSKTSILKGCIRILHSYDRSMNKGNISGENEAAKCSDLSLLLQIFLQLVCYAPITPDLSSADTGMLRSFIKKLPPGFLNNIVTGTENPYTTSFRVQLAHGIDLLEGRGSCIQPEEWHKNSSFSVFKVKLQSFNCFSRGLWKLLDGSWTGTIVYSEGVVYELRLLGSWCVYHKHDKNTYPVQAAVSCAIVKLLKLSYTTEPKTVIDTLCSLLNAMESWEYVPAEDLVFLIFIALKRTNVSNPVVNCDLVRESHRAMGNRSLLSFSNGDPRDVISIINILSAEVHFIKAIPLFALLSIISCKLLNKTSYEHMKQLIQSMRRFLIRGRHRNESSDEFENNILPELEDALIEIPWPKSPPLLIEIFSLFMHAEHDLHFRGCTSHLSERLHREIFNPNFISEFPQSHFNNCIRYISSKYYYSDGTIQHDPINALIDAVADSQSSYETNSWKDIETDIKNKTEDHFHELLTTL